jgi:hypothetical protein
MFHKVLLPMFLKFLDKVLKLCMPWILRIFTTRNQQMHNIFNALFYLKNSFFRQNELLNILFICWLHVVNSRKGWESWLSINYGILDSEEY